MLLSVFVHSLRHYNTTAKSSFIFTHHCTELRADFYSNKLTRLLIRPTALIHCFCTKLCTEINYDCFFMMPWRNNVLVAATTAIFSSHWDNLEGECASMLLSNERHMYAAWMPTHPTLRTQLPQQCVVLHCRKHVLSHTITVFLDFFHRLSSDWD
jgi:hypothetical protein